MIIQSEITGKTYKTVEECLADEKAFQQKKLDEEREKKEFERKANVALKVVQDSWRKYIEVLESGGFHVDRLDEMMLLFEVIGNDEDE